MRDQLPAERFANKIMMMKSHSSFLIVEGKTDELLFGKFCVDDCYILDVNGKQVVQETITILNERKFRSALAIRDSDFDLILNCKPFVDNFFFSDYHDIEISILNTKTLHTVIFHVGSKDKIDKYLNHHGRNSIFPFLLSTSEMLSKIKLANIKFGLGMKFKPNQEEKPIDYSKLFNKENLSPVDATIMIDVIYQYSLGKSKGLKPKKDIIEAYNEIRETNYDLMHLCNGHDIAALIQLACQRFWGNKSRNEISIDDIEYSLIFGYDSLDFMSTKLYSDIKKWEKKTNTTLLRC